MSKRTSEELPNAIETSDPSDYCYRDDDMEVFDDFSKVSAADEIPSIKGVEHFRLDLRHPSVEPFLKSVKEIFANNPEIINDFKTIPMRKVKIVEFFEMIDKTEIMSCEGELLSFTISIEEPVNSNLLPPGARILNDLSDRASSEAAGFDKETATSVDGGLEEIVSIFERIRAANGTVVFQSGAADIHAVWSTSAIGRFLNGEFFGRGSYETRIYDLFGQDSDNPIQWYDTYRNSVATAIGKSLYGEIDGATLSLSLTNMSKILK
ncbi:hypothetical protein TrVE_jg6254 [Triparma verrucosa]|uniref:Uncharacterized protein n=1 Tax=Triparma verrucosa TaxID=1606542 RepID=A0A9W7BFU3_9STRA|nr:hypothetical protein TrVE_jg6254 [Triparma verrucosa]